MPAAISELSSPAIAKSIAKPWRDSAITTDDSTATRRPSRRTDHQMPEELGLDGPTW